MKLQFGPDPNTLFPIKDEKRLIFLKNFIKAPNIFVGDYTYYADLHHAPEKFEENNILYNYLFANIELIIGKFCSIASDTRFMMAGNHKLDAFSTYPFSVFEGWGHAFNVSALPAKGNTVVGNDVWFGYDSLIMNGVTIGDGAIIGTRALVVKDVPAYSIVAGNPAKVVKMRFDDATIQRLLDISWWDWDIEKITACASIICNMDIDRLEDAYFAL